MGCGRISAREQLQERLLLGNPSWLALEAGMAPDGDADLDGIDFSTFNVPPCPYCAGILKPHVVFFGESVPADRVGAAMRGVHSADAMLVVGSSLMIYSGYRFAQAAAQAGKPIAAVNLGRTRADDLLALKVTRPCSSALGFLLESAGHNASPR
jgi:NAD-dependent SIR2 family protein deacetylase